MMFRVETPPQPLPPAGPCAIARAADVEHALAALDTAARALPNVAELCAGALTVEAVASARIDGHDVTLAELLAHEAVPPAPRADASGDCPPSAGVAAAARHLDALRFGQRRLAGVGMLTGDILLGVLARLIGPSSPGASNVPAPVIAAIGVLDQSLRDPTARGSAVTAVAVTAHMLGPLAAELPQGAPLARIGALLALCGSLRPWRALTAPSAGVLCRQGPSEDRVASTLLASDESISVLEQASTIVADEIIEGVASALALMHRASVLAEENERRIGSFSGAAHSARLVHRALQADPITSLPQLLCDTGLRIQAATSALHRLRALGIVREVTGRRRHRIYSYDGWIALLDESLCGRAMPRGRTLSPRGDV